MYFLGDLEFFENLMMNGYDHIIDVSDGANNSVIQVAELRGHHDLSQFLENLREFEVIINNH